MQVGLTRDITICRKLSLLCKDIYHTCHAFIEEYERYHLSRFLITRVNNLEKNLRHDNERQAGNDVTLSFDNWILILEIKHCVQQPRLALIGEGSSVLALGQQVLVSVLEGS